MPKYRLPWLNSLRAFEAAARHQSVKRAGDELHVTYAAVTRHIQKLEAQIGRKLFDRHHRRVVLTEAGEILSAAVRDGFAHIQRAFVQLRGGAGLERLVILVDPDFAGLWLVPRLGDFYRKLPESLVEIIARRAPLTVEDARVSCIIQYAEVSSDGAEGEFLLRSRLFPVCAPELIAGRAIDRLKDLQGLVLLHDRTLDEWQDYATEEEDADQLNLRSGVVFSDTTLCLDAAVRGQGVAMGDDCLASQHLTAGRLVRLFEREVPSKNAYYFLNARPGDPKSVVVAFRDWLIDSIHRERCLLPDID